MYKFDPAVFTASVRNATGTLTLTRIDGSVSTEPAVQIDENDVGRRWQDFRAVKMHAIYTKDNPIELTFNRQYLVLARTDTHVLIDQTDTGRTNAWFSAKSFRVEPWRNRRGH